MQILYGILIIIGGIIAFIGGSFYLRAGKARGISPQVGWALLSVGVGISAYGALITYSGF